MNRQQCFDIAAPALLKQGRKSLQNPECEPDHEKCAYRGADGSRCAVGFLIADECYDRRMEDKTAAQLIRDFPDLGPLLSGAYANDVHFLTDMQMIHDEEAPEMWPEAFRRLARNYGLSTAVLDK